MPPISTLQRCAFAVLAACALALPACESDGHFCLFGYTTRPNYDTTIHTVHVPIFKNTTIQDSTRRGFEFELTEAVIREIEMRTPYKVVGPNYNADTELSGTIISNPKLLLNRTQLNEIREGETTMAMNIVWKDLRPGRCGELLSQPKKPGMPPVEAVPLVGPPPPQPPVLVQSRTSYIPELGQTNISARQQNINLLAKQIVNMMEKPW